MQSFQAWARESESDDLMSSHLPELSPLHPTGQSSCADPDEVREPSLRPALLARYGELSKLRYDYPLVLVKGDADDASPRSLSGVIDGILQEIAPRGVEGGRLRAHVLRLEEEIRTLASRSTKGSLSQLWDLAEKNLLSRNGDGAGGQLRDSLSRARGSLRVDGEVIDCDEETPTCLLTHLWEVVQEKKAQGFRDTVDRLIVKLSDVLKADFMRSREGRSPENLKRSVGTAYESSFDFEAMSRILGNGLPNDSLPESRRQRIRSTLSVLQSQRFFAPPGERGEDGAGQPHSFVFESCTRALEAFQERLPEMLALITAVSIAELEIENRYNESRHDSFFSRFDESSLVPEDLAPFPSYLVCVRDGSDDAAEKTKAIEILSSGLPVKILVQSNDISEEMSIGAGQFCFGVKGLQLASMAVGLTGAYVLQSSSSHLYQLGDQILKGLTYPGPALFSVFSGAAGNSSAKARNVTDLPPYLMAAAAMESRAFPAFTYDPSAGADWASRFRVSDNPQADCDWPSHRLSHQDEDLQGISEDVAFTFVDFVACDARYAGSFARVPRGEWHGGMIPVSEALGREAPEKVPYVLMVDERNFLHRVTVEDKLIDAARRCREMWHGLQELGGINNSHARRLLAREKEIWEEEKARELEALRGRPEQETEGPDVPEQAPTSEEPAQIEVEEPAEAPTDEPYIETPRCTTCNECTEINNRMFVYDENMQAYIADPDAGTYRQLVEAAESCQVCIIHPGKPRNPNEPNLDELIKRAEPFQA
jgi:hypothetical protein